MGDPFVLRSQTSIYYGRRSMPVNPAAVGFESVPTERSWTSDDCLLYAFGVGAGVDDLAYTTENTAGIAQRALPTTAVVLTTPGDDVWGAIGDVEPTWVVHGAESLDLHRPLPVAGRLRAVSRITGVYDKGRAAVVEITTSAVDAGTGGPLFTTRMQLFVRGAGGFGGSRGTGAALGRPTPDRRPDASVAVATDRNQALLYRLSGDRSRLHSDPAFARQAGFDRPILHGLATFGIAGRVLLRECCAGDPDRFGSMAARFAAPVFPGDDLVVDIWAEDDGYAFRALCSNGTAVLDHGWTTSLPSSTRAGSASCPS